MKPIHLPSIRRIAKQQVIEDLTSAQNNVNSLPSDKKGDFIDKNGEKWTALKEELWKLGNMKCWYSEAKLEFGLAEVEHFRPKKKVTGEDHSGYWWCAFRWENLRIAHPVVNKRMTDFQTQQCAGKGCYFPLQEGCSRANCEAEQKDEKPELIDPIVAGDCQLIAFDSNNGKAVPKFEETNDRWKNKRAQSSISFYHLNEGTWIARREDIMKAVGSLCDQLITIQASSPFDSSEYNRIIDFLFNEYLNSASEFLSSAEQVLKEKNLDIRF